MNFYVVSHLVLWYLLISVCGVVVWITLSPISKGLADKGYALSKTVALIIPSLIAWVFGFVFKFPLNQFTSIAILLSFLTICIGIQVYRKGRLPKVKWKHIIVIEVVFLILAAIGLAITSIHPTIDNTTERIMDFKILNVATNSENLPLKDLWHTPDTINYYYYGYFFFGFINKITGTDPYMGYLFAMGIIYALAGTIIFSLAFSIKKSYLLATLGILMTLFFSNFTFIWGDKLNSDNNIVANGFLYNFFSTLPDEQKLKFMTFSIDALILCAILFSLYFIKRKDMKSFLYISIVAVIAHLTLTGAWETVNTFFRFITDTSKSTLWYPDVSRVISSTINEFPFYSVIIGDLHPHYLDLIFTPTVLTLIFLEIKYLTPTFIDRYVSHLPFREKNFKQLAKVRNFTEKYLKKTFNVYGMVYLIIAVFFAMTLYLVQNPFFYVFAAINIIPVFVYAVILKLDILLHRKIFYSKGFNRILVLKLITALIFSAGIATNSWELICFGALFAVKDIIFIFRSINYIFDKTNGGNLRVIKLSLIPILFDAVVGIIAVGLQIPYVRSITAPVSGIRLNFINNHQGFSEFFKTNFDFIPIFQNTNGVQYTLGLNTIILFIATAVVVAISIKKHINKKITRKVVIIFNLIFIPFMFILSAIVETIVAYVQRNFDLSPFNQFFNVWIVFFVMCIISLIFLFIKARRGALKTADYFIMALIFTGIVLAISTEFFYVAEYFARSGYEHHRANTVFKVNYLNFIFLGIVSAWSIYKLFTLRKWQAKYADDFRKYIISAMLSFLRIFIYAVIIGILFYVPYTISQWLHFFYSRVDIFFFIAPLWILIALILLSVLYRTRIRIFMRLSKFMILPVVFLALVSSVFVDSSLLPAIQSKPQESSSIQIANQMKENILYSNLTVNVIDDTSKLHPSLDGLEQTTAKYPEIIEAAQFLQRVKTKGDVLLEANGDAYKLTSIGSVFSLMPTILGWWGHEAQWRETADPNIIDSDLGKRMADISNVYTLNTGGPRSSLNNSILDYDSPSWQGVLSKYNIKYVWVGDNEREKFTTNVDRIFDSISCFNKVFENNKVKIYKVESCG